MPDTLHDVEQRLVERLKDRAGTISIKELAWSEVEQYPAALAEIKRQLRKSRSQHAKYLLNHYAYYLGRCDGEYAIKAQFGKFSVLSGWFNSKHEFAGNRSGF